MFMLMNVYLEVIDEIKRRNSFFSIQKDHYNVGSKVCKEAVRIASMDIVGDLVRRACKQPTEQSLLTTLEEVLLYFIFYYYYHRPVTFS